MAKQVINIGTTANDGTGDPLRSAFDKVNDNFTELYSDDQGDVGSIIAGADISVDQATGNVTVTNTAPDQTVTLTEGANVTITGTYPDFTIASDDVVGAVTSVNGQTGVAVLDTADISEDTNLYYTEARVSANTSVAANTAKTGITTQQAADIVANNAKVSGVESITATSPLAVDASTGDVTLTIENGLITALQLAVTGNGASGQSLVSDGDGTFSWQYGASGTVYEINADAGLTGGGSGLSTVNLAVNPDNETIEIVSDQVRVKPYQVVNLTVPTFQTALKNYLYIFSSTSSTVSTLTLPASPAAGDSIKISNIGLQANIINPNGNKIMATTGNMTIDTPNSAFELIYSGVALTGWIILSNV